MSARTKILIAGLAAVTGLGILLYPLLNAPAGRTAAGPAGGFRTGPRGELSPAPLESAGQPEHPPAGTTGRAGAQLPEGRRTARRAGTTSGATSGRPGGAEEGQPPAARAAGPWGQWRGPNRDGVSTETGLLESWPAGGPKMLWKAVGLGGGYSTPSVTGSRIYGMGYVEGQEMVWALQESDGKGVWRVPIGQANRRQKGYSDGSRSTPTVDGSRMYALGDSGDLVCLETGSGKLVWRKDLVADLGGGVPQWGYAESPLVDGDRVIVTPGGVDAPIVALNKDTGDVIWKAKIPGGDRAQYASAITATVDGLKQYIQFMGGGAVGVSAADGSFLWRYDRHANLTANISTPIFRDNQVLITAGYNSGGGLVKLARNGNAISATEAYFTSDLKNKHGGCVLVGDYVYGFDDPGTLVCLEWKSGKTMWRDRSVGGNASVTYADGHLYCRSARGPVALVEATPAGYKEKGQFEQPERSAKDAWPHPVIANKRLYLRDQDILLCYDVKEPDAR